QPLGNSRIGIYVNSAQAAWIGGGSSGDGNVISGNGWSGGYSGIYIQGIRSTSIVEGNYIGVSANGLAAIGNYGDGITIVDSPDNYIGGVVLSPSYSEGNVIAGNAKAGVSIAGSDAKGNRIQGNLVGTDKSGTKLPLATVTGGQTQQTGI